MQLPSPGTDPGLTEDSVLTFLRDNPGLLQQLDTLDRPQLPPAKSEKQILPPVIPPGPGIPGFNFIGVLSVIQVFGLSKKNLRTCNNFYVSLVY